MAGHLCTMHVGTAIIRYGSEHAQIYITSKIKDIDVKDIKMSTPLMYSIFRESKFGDALRIIRNLLFKGARRDLLDLEILTQLHYISDDNRPVVLKYLKNGCDFFQRIPNNKSGLQLPILFNVFMVCIYNAYELLVFPVASKVLFRINYNDAVIANIIYSSVPFIIQIALVLFMILSNPGVLKANDSINFMV